MSPTDEHGRPRGLRPDEIADEPCTRCGGIGYVTRSEASAAEAGWTELTERIAAGWSIARLTLNDEGAIAVEWVG